MNTRLFLHVFTIQARKLMSYRADFWLSSVVSFLVELGIMFFLWRAVFAESGCGGCHAIRGTPWQGREGPDLSGLGSRLTIGAGLFPMNRGTIAGWVADAQGLKPGSRMPSFAPAIAGPDLRALGMWLESLR